MRLITLFAFAGILAMLAPSPAVASPCPGMLSYTYEVGVCTDRTGDTTDILIRSGNESEELQQSMIARSQTVGPSGTTYAGNQQAAHLYETLAGALAVNYNGPAIEPAPFARRLQPKNAQLRAKLARIFTAELMYYQSAPFNRAFHGANWLPGARELFIESAYNVFDGETIPDQATRTLNIRAFTKVMTGTQIPAESEVAKEDLRENYVIRALHLVIVSEYYKRHHLTAKYASLQRDARNALALDLEVDPATLPLTDIFCRVYNFAGMLGSCARERRALTGRG